jgi:DNA-binding beta-propeller fold protein YncE
MTRLKSVMPQPSQLEFSPDGKILAVVNGRGQVVLMDPATNRVLESADCGVSGVAALAWTRDGNRLVGIGGDAIFQCERRDGRITRAAFAEQANRSGLVFDQLWVDPSDRHVAAASTQGRVVLLWSLPQLTPRASLQAP